MDDTNYKVVQLGEDLFAIEEGWVRFYLLVGIEAALLIDTGRGTGDLLSVIKSITPLPIIVANTHADPDHTGGNHFFGRAYLHPAEFDHYRKLNGYKDTLVPMWEGDFIDIGGGQLEVILVPGHTPGSVAFLDQRNGLLFAGDTLQTGEIHMFGEGRNLEAYVYSLKKLLNMRNDFKTIYCAHGDTVFSVSNLTIIERDARMVLEGDIDGVNTDTNAPYKLYNIGAAKLLY